MKRVLYVMAAVAMAGLLAVWAHLPQRLALWMGWTAPGRPPHTAACVAPCSQTTVSIVTLNVMCSFCDREGYDPWPQRAPEIHTMLQRHHPDLIGLQEVSNIEALESLLDMNQYAFSAPRLGDGWYTDAIVAYRTERFSVIDEGAWWLTPTPHIPFSWAWSPASFPRLLTWVLLRERASGQAILVSTTHIDNNRANKDHAAAMLGQLLPQESLQGPVLFTGDFNTHAKEDRFPALQGELQNIADHAEVMQQLGVLDGVAHTRRELRPDRRIDHILFASPAPITVVEWRHDASVYGSPPRRPSDHPAIAAILELSASR